MHAHSRCLTTCECVVPPGKANLPDVWSPEYQRHSISKLRVPDYTKVNSVPQPKTGVPFTPRKERPFLSLFRTLLASWGES